MTTSPQTIYFDEAGFTGNNLLDSQQPTFVCAAIAIDENRSSELISEARARFRLQSIELKGANLRKHQNGRKAISWILDETQDQSRIIVADKQFAVAGKLFEYVFEPLLSDCNSLFYQSGFQKFVANLLYYQIAAGNADAKKVITDFSSMMRNLDYDDLDSVLESLSQFGGSDPLGHLYNVARSNRDRLIGEIDAVRSSGFLSTWALELSMTGLHWLLAVWGEIFSELQVYCDDSKPLHASREFFNVFVGRKEKAYVPFGDWVSPSFIYNLASPVIFVDSKSSTGVQIADIISSSISYALNHSNDVLSEQWIRHYANDRTIYIGPEHEYLDPLQENTYVNSVVLHELSDRSSSNRDLCEGMAEFIMAVKSLYPRFRAEVRT